MDTAEISLGSCPMARALSRVGDTWSMLVLRDVAQGMRRFEELRRSLGIAPTILTRRLKALTEDGLLEKRRYSERPPRDEYVLTDAGRDFLPILHALGAWGRRHHGEGKLTHFIDVQTGHAIRPVVIDAETGAPIGTRELRAVIP